MAMAGAADGMVAVVVGMEEEEAGTEAAGVAEAGVAEAGMVVVGMARDGVGDGAAHGPITAPASSAQVSGIPAGVGDGITPTALAGTTLILIPMATMCLSRASMSPRSPHNA